MPLSFKSHWTQLALVCLVGGIAACGVGGGGGGGGGDTESANYAGDIDFQLETDSLDSGDLTQVRVTVRNMNPDGVILKFHYPDALKYQRGSGVLYVGYDNYSERVYAAGDGEVSNSEGRYLAFFLFPRAMDNGNDQTVQFNMKAIAPNMNAYIEVDLDNNDPNVPDSLEFSAADPAFTNVDRWNLDISGTPIATPTPGGSETPGASTSPTPAATATPSK